MSSVLGSNQPIVFLPPGAMVDFAGTSSPAGWLMCDGSAVSRSAYASLFATIGTAYGIGDGSTTFNLPDYRGKFARYNDDMGTGAGAAGIDPSRTIGSTQTQATAVNGLGIGNTDLSHNHTTNKTGGLTIGSNASGHSDAPGGSPFTTTTSTAGLNHAHAISGDSETRPVNLSSNRIIKY